MVTLTELGSDNTYKLLRRFEYDSQRKILTVIIERDGIIELFTKGQLDSVEPLINKQLLQ